MKILLPLLLTVLACNQLSNGYRILGLLPLPGRSHFVVMEKLFLGLAKRGHQVDVYSHFPQTKPVPNYTDISLVGTADTVVNNISIKDTSQFNSFSMSHFAQIAGDKVCTIIETEQLQKLIKNPPKDPPYDMVILEMFAANCFLAFGRHFNVPVVGVAASILLDWYNEPFGNPMNPAFVPSVFSATGQRMGFVDRLKNTLLTTVITGQLNYYTESQVDIVKKNFGIELNSIQDLYKDVALILTNSHHSLHGIRPYTTGVVEVAGIHVNDHVGTLPADVQKWLDEAKDGFVYVSFGSMVRIETLPDERIKAFYESFAKIAPIRILMKIARPEELLPGVPKNVMIKSWFNQPAVLKHKNIKAFVTHGGLMSTIESIHFGVPLIGIPIFGDQHVNIINLVNKKIAVSLASIQNITEPSLTHALKTILQDKTYRENMKKLSTVFKDRPIPPMDTATFWVEYVGRHGKSLQSPAMDLNFWQRNLYDVYAFLAACVITLLYICYRVVKCTMGWICSKICTKKRAKETASKKNK